MGARGPAPKPTALKVAQGNPGKRALNANEPKPDATMPQCPRWLNKAARGEWQRVARRLHNAGVLTYVDRGVLAVYCQAYGRLVEAETELRLRGDVIETTNGNLVQSPYLQIANRAMDQMVRAAKELGMTPASRSSIKIDKPELSLADILFAEVES